MEKVYNYVKTDRGDYLLQVADDDQWGFSLWTDDQSFAGGFDIAEKWHIVDRKEVPEKDLEWMDNALWNLDEYDEGRIDGNNVTKERAESLWEELRTPIFLVVDINSFNMADARVRRLNENYFVYADNVDGFDIIESDVVSDWALVEEDEYVEPTK